MAVIQYREALNQAIDEEMHRDEDVLIMGEEVAQYNGAYKVTRGILDKYGPGRVLDTPITECGFTGVGIGAAISGLRPIVEWMTYNFAFQAIDQVINNAAKLRYMTGGQVQMPIVFRGPNGAAGRLGAQHSHACGTYYAHVPGLIVAAPYTAYDAKGLLKSAIRSNDPVCLLEGEILYGDKGEVPEDEYLVPLGKANVTRNGNDVTLVSFGCTLACVYEAAGKLTEQGISVEVVDLRTIRPIDEETIYASVNKTSRCVVIDESWEHCSVGASVAYMISRNCFDSLDAQVELVSGLDVPMPYNSRLEQAVKPSAQRVIDAVNTVLYND